MSNPIDCPCGSSRGYSTCCEPLHSGAAIADSALMLMRSRYSAYVLDRTEYLLASWAPETRPAYLAATEPGLRWLGLTVRRHVQSEPDRAIVEFVARYKIGGRAHRIEEISEFECRGGRWFYIRAQQPPPVPAGR